MNSFSTIITSDYFLYAKALFGSLKRFDDQLSFHVLVVGDGQEDLSYEDIKVHKLSDLERLLPEDYSLIEKYNDDIASNLRWALKPLFLKYLLMEKKYEKVIFVDPDLYFYNSPLFLFDFLDKGDVIITPHWRSKDPFKDPDNFNSLFTGGLYNAGFFGCTSNSINILDWWLRVCSYKMEKHQGFYVDQAYLNLMPIYFSNQVEVLDHKGCNVSNWNMIECKRTTSENDVVINNEYPIVFIHYTKGTINEILYGSDGLLQPFLDEYFKALTSHNTLFKHEPINGGELDNVSHSLKTKLKMLLKF